MRRVGQPARDRVASRELDAVDAVHLHHPAGPIAATVALVPLEQVGELLERRGDVELAAVEPRLEVAEALDRILDPRSSRRGCRTERRLAQAFDERDRCLRRPAVRVHDAGHRAVLHPLRQVLALAVRLPATERGERAVGDVALRLAVADQPDIGRARDARPQRLGPLQLPRGTVSRANASVRPGVRRPAPARPRPGASARAGPRRRSRLVAVGRDLAALRPPRLVAGEVRGRVVPCGRKPRHRVRCRSRRTSRRSCSRSRRAPCRTGPRSR